MACKNRRRKKNKRGQAGLYVAFIFVAFIIVTLAAIFAPIGVEFTIQLYAAGEEIWLDAQEDITQINNADIRNALNDTISAARAATTTNVEVLGAFFQYGWILVLVLSGLVVYLLTRRLVEVGGGGGRGFV